MTSGNTTVAKSTNKYPTTSLATLASISTIIQSTQQTAITSSSESSTSIKITTSTTFKSEAMSSSIHSSQNPTTMKEITYEEPVKLSKTTSNMTTDEITGKMTVSVKPLQMTNFKTTPIFSLTSSQKSTLYKKYSTSSATTINVGSTTTKMNTISHERTQHTKFITMQNISTEGKWTIRHKYVQ